MLTGYCLCFVRGYLYCVLRLGTHYVIMSECRLVEHVRTYWPSVDVEEFRAGILGAGTGLAPFLEVEYPSADLVSAALCNVWRLWRVTA